LYRYSKVVLDLFCGVGTLGLCVASQVGGLGSALV
jgi:tRNA/tmRNA/rRNA uracil-C5-methylase (TrmA/RlmC/RlmD family)